MQVLLLFAWVSGLRVRTVEKRIRMPDVVALLDESKRVEYQQAGIPEYWIVDPAKGRVIVLALKDGA